MKIVFALVLGLISSVSFATPKTTTSTLKIECEAAVGSVSKGPPATQLAITYQDGDAYFYDRISGYIFNGVCGHDTCDFSIKKENKGGFTAFNGGFSPLNDNQVYGGIYEAKDLVAEVTCKKINK